MDIVRKDVCKNSCLFSNTWFFYLQNIDNNNNLQPHRGPIEAIMRSLSENIEGRTLPDLVAVAGVARHRCNEYLGVLIHAKEVIKTSQKGVVFSLNPDRYPSR